MFLLFFSNNTDTNCTSFQEKDIFIMKLQPKAWWDFPQSNPKHNHDPQKVGHWVKRTQKPNEKIFRFFFYLCLSKSEFKLKNVLVFCQHKCKVRRTVASQFWGGIRVVNKTVFVRTSFLFTSHINATQRITCQEKGWRGSQNFSPCFRCVDSKLGN